jgi:hypothetical protein
LVSLAKVNYVVDKANARQSVHSKRGERGKTAPQSVVFSAHLFGLRLTLHLNPQ